MDKEELEKKEEEKKKEEKINKTKKEVKAKKEVESKKEIEIENVGDAKVDKEDIKKEKEKKKSKFTFLKVIWNIIYYALVLFIFAILAIIVMQRATKNNKAIAGIRIFNIATASMDPDYKVGDVIIVKETDPSELKVGDDITYVGDEKSFKDKIVTHRIVKIEQENGKYMFHTKGIANIVEDPPISENQVYGKIIYKTKFLSYMTKIINNTTMFFFVIFVPLTLLIVVKIIQVKKEKDDDDDDNEEDDEEEVEDK